MRLLATTPEADLSRLPIAVDLRAVSLAEGLRAALSIAAIVAAGEWLHRPPLLEAALGALLTCLGDGGGPIRRRLPSLLTFTAAGALFTACFPLLRGLGVAYALPFACAGIFGCSFARAWGQSSLQVGNLLAVVLILALDEPRQAGESLLLAGAFAGGSLWAVLLTMVIWRIHPFRPARHAVADAYRAVARLAGDLRDLDLRSAGQPEWDAHARGHRRAVRDTIEAARTAVQDTLRVRGQNTPRAYQALLRLEAVDQLFGALIGLSDLLEATPDPAIRDAAARMLGPLRHALYVISDAIRGDDPGQGKADAVGRLAELDPVLDAVGEGARTPALNAVTQYLLERLRVAATLTAPADWHPGALPDSPPPLSRWQRFAGPLRANLSWQSAVFRHALRAATVAVPALAFTLSFSGRYQHWLTITLLLTMQPFYAATWQRALERIGGTVLGGLAAAALSLLCTTPLSIAGALFPLAVLAFAARAVNFGLFIALLTPMVVLLTEITHAGESELLIAGLRAAYTVAGGVLAVAGCLLLWPSWEPDRLRRELEAALRAHAAFARAELDALLGGAEAAVDPARRAAGMASNNLETSITRALQEPRRSQRATLQSVMVADAALRRMAGRLSALQLDPRHAGGIGPDALTRWRDWITGSLERLAGGEPAGAAKPDGPAPDALLRIARQIELMDGALMQKTILPPTMQPSRA